MSADPAAAATARLSAAPWIVAATMVLIVGTVLRFVQLGGPYELLDEEITSSVVGTMLSSGHLDTNWANAEGLDPELRYDQYNFSSYLYGVFWFTRIVEFLASPIDLRALVSREELYRVFSALLSSLVVWQAMVVARRIDGRMPAIVAGLLCAVSVQLVQDGHYSRPEAFATSLTLALFWLALPRRELSVPVVSGASIVMGLLVACKISMLLLAWLPVVPLLATWRESVPRKRIAALLAIPLGVIGGFALGAPGALAHPDVFMNGVEYLFRQYSGGTPPHGHLDGSPVADILAGYYGATLGWPLIILAVAGVARIVRRRQWACLSILAAPALLFAAYFSTKAVFFERNLSHVLPSLLILSAFGTAELVGLVSRRNRVAGRLTLALLVASTAVPSLRLTLPLVHDEMSGERLLRVSRFEKALRAQFPDAHWALENIPAIDRDPPSTFHERLASAEGPVLARLVDYNDEWSARTVVELSERYEVRQVGDYPSTFARVPVSTLHTYHSPRAVYFLITGLRKSE